MAVNGMAPLTLTERVLALPSVSYTERRSRLPDRPGLYFAIRDDSEIVYIGMARKSILRRWKNWHSAATSIENDGVSDQVRIAYILYDDVVRLAEDERAAIRQFSPRYNYSHVPGAFVRMQQRMAEACRYIDCRFHDHIKWPAQQPTEPWPGWR